MTVSCSNSNNPKMTKTYFKKWNNLKLHDFDMKENLPTRVTLTSNSCPDHWITIHDMGTQNFATKTYELHPENTTTFIILLQIIQNRKPKEILQMSETYKAIWQSVLFPTGPKVLNFSIGNKQNGTS